MICEIGFEFVHTSVFLRLCAVGIGILQLSSDDAPRESFPIELLQERRAGFSHTADYGKNAFVSLFAFESGESVGYEPVGYRNGFAVEVLHIEAVEPLPLGLALVFGVVFGEALHRFVHLDQPKIVRVVLEVVARLLRGAILGKSDILAFVLAQHLECDPFANAVEVSGKRGGEAVGCQSVALYIAPKANTCVLEYLRQLFVVFDSKLTADGFEEIGTESVVESGHSLLIVRAESVDVFLVCHLRLRE